MSDTGSWGIHPLTDKNGDPIVGRQLRAGDYVLLSAPNGEVYEVQLKASHDAGDGVIGFHCQTIHQEEQ